MREESRRNQVVGEQWFAWENVVELQAAGYKRDTEFQFVV